MSRDEVRAVDQWAINTLGVPGVVLMENAGRSCAELIKEKLAETRRMCLKEQINAESHIYAGKTADEIMLAAKEYKASIIFMGSKDERKLFKRNSSCKVVERSHLPVLVMP